MSSIQLIANGNGGFEIDLAFERKVLEIVQSFVGCSFNTETKRWTLPNSEREAFGLELSQYLGSLNLKPDSNDVAQGNAVLASIENVYMTPINCSKRLKFDDFEGKENVQKSTKSIFIKIKKDGEKIRIKLYGYDIPAFDILRNWPGKKFDGTTKEWVFVKNQEIAIRKALDDLSYIKYY